MKDIMSSPGMFSFTYEEILDLIKKKYVKFKEDRWRGFTLMKNKKKREIEIMRDLMPVYRENILDNPGLEPFTLNIKEMQEKVKREGFTDFDFQQYQDLVDDISDLKQ
jgi:hypothetical protein